MTAAIGIHVFFGLIASGKSTLARAWAERCGSPYHNSDVVRKELAGSAAGSGGEAGYHEGIYSPEFTARTYTALRQRAEADIREGRATVLDASYADREERVRVRKLAERLGVPVYFVLCVCPEEEMKRRMALRAQDPAAVSDGRWEIYLKQKERFSPPQEGPSAGSLITIDTTAPPDRLVARLEELLPLQTASQPQ